MLHPKTLKATPEVSTNKEKKSFWGAVSLIIGTAVGPGMLGLPAATIRSGPIPSTIAIILSWIYVISSILLVAELSFSSMDDDGLEEVSFTDLANKVFGSNFAAFVAVVYTSLSFSLLVACVSGIGSLLARQFPSMHPVAAYTAFPCAAGAVIGFLPFAAIDVTNRLLCSLMLFSITALVAVGLSVGRSHVLSSLSNACWWPSSILPAIPVTVLTLGFHVITPFMCKIVGDTVSDARKAILVGGSVPLAMVLSWNLVVLGLSGSNPMAASGGGDPIKMLLSVDPSALPAVQGFALTALATSLIGYAVSFPKQLMDTAELIARMGGRIGCSTSEMAVDSGSRRNATAMWIVLGAAILIAAFFQASFSKALDFAGVYANCFLFGILPPVMAWIYRSRMANNGLSDKRKAALLPGGNGALMLLFVVAIVLGIWH